MGLLSSILSITSNVISNSAAEKKAGTAKGELFADFDATVERLKSFDLEAPVDDKTAVSLPRNQTGTRKNDSTLYLSAHPYSLVA